MSGVPEKRTRAPTPQEAQELRAWESSTLEAFLAGMGEDEVFAALGTFLQTGTTEAALRAVEQRPELASEQGDAALAMVIGFAEQTGFVMLLPALQRRRRWLLDLREAGWAAESPA